MKKIIPLLILQLSILSVALGQNHHPVLAGGGEYVFEKNPCITPSEWQIETAKVKQNIRKLQKSGILPEISSRMAVSFDWPLQKASGLNWNDYYGISNYVDQDGTAGLEDYNCLMKTYDGHRGTDFFTWPFPGYLQENDLVEVIAGAAGTIVGKFDGNDDDHCSCSGDWNAVYIEHADGSVAFYGHLKKNSLTTKGLGDMVAVGEFLGVVGSSGCSTGPHLHFEVYTDDSFTNLIDPYYVSTGCNSLNSVSWWASQRDYETPTVNALLTHDDIPVMGCPGTAESPHLADAFSPGQTAYFAAYYHDQQSGHLSTYRIKRPDGTTYSTWTHTSPGTYFSSYWYWIFSLPLTPTGTWSFEVDYEGNTIVHSFTVDSGLPVDLVSFDGYYKKPEVALSWQTASEIRVRQFELQRKHAFDEPVWQTIGHVKPAGSSSHGYKYEMMDNNPKLGKNYYRLKWQDDSGTEEYSNIIAIEVEEDIEAMVQIFPNPVSKNQETWVVVPEGGTATMELYDQLGHKIEEGIRHISKNNPVPLPFTVQNLTPGVYFLKIGTNNSTFFKRMLVR